MAATKLHRHHPHQLLMLLLFVASLESCWSAAEFRPSRLFPAVIAAVGYHNHYWYANAYGRIELKDFGNASSSCPGTDSADFRNRASFAVVRGVRGSNFLRM